MPLYMVERDLPGITMERLAAAQRAVVDTSNRFAARGEYIRYIRSIYIPGESRCLCLFEAPKAETVDEVNEVAKTPFTKIIEVIELTPEQ